MIRESQNDSPPRRNRWLKISCRWHQSFSTFSSLEMNGPKKAAGYNKALHTERAFWNGGCPWSVSHIPKQILLDDLLDAEISEKHQYWCSCLSLFQDERPVQHGMTSNARKENIITIYWFKTAVLSTTSSIKYYNTYKTMIRAFRILLAVPFS